MGKQKTRPSDVATPGGHPQRSSIPNKVIHLIIREGLDLILWEQPQAEGGRNPMRQIQIDLTLMVRMPESSLNVNGVIMGLRNVSAKTSFTLLEASFSAIEGRTIELGFWIDRSWNKIMAAAASAMGYPQDNSLGSRALVIGLRSSITTIRIVGRHSRQRAYPSPPEEAIPPL